MGTGVKKASTFPMIYMHDIVSWNDWNLVLPT